MKQLANVLVCLGICVSGIGIHEIYRPAAWIWFGMSMIVVGIGLVPLIARKERRR